MEPGLRCESGLPDDPGRGPATHRRSSARAGGGRALRCAACGAPITSEDARTEVGEAHQHTFLNPHGLVFEIGCFRSAPGCVSVGPAQAFFSWFPGYAWRVVVCRGCSAHLGWSYGDPIDFYGLILDRLHAREDDDDDA